MYTLHCAWCCVQLHCACMHVGMATTLGAFTAEGCLKLSFTIPSTQTLNWCYRYTLHCMCTLHCLCMPPQALREFTAEFTAEGLMLIYYTFHKHFPSKIMTAISCMLALWQCCVASEAVTLLLWCMLALWEAVTLLLWCADIFEDVNKHCVLCLVMNPH